MSPAAQTGRPEVESVDAHGRALVLGVAPQRGGKIVSLRSSGREWLSPTGRLLDSPSGLSFVEAEMSGWDECAPTINEATLPDGTELSDHGDLWDRSWRGEQRPDGLRTVVDGMDWPYTFTRTVRAVPGGFALDYRVVNNDRVARPFLWAAHPQFLAEPGSWVEVPQANQVIDIEAPGELLEFGRSLQVVAERRSRKLWSLAEDRIDHAILHHPDGSSLRLRWSGDAVRWCGIWIDAAEYASRRVIAVEPSSGWYDDAAEAAARDRVLVLAPGAQADWTLVLEPDEPLLDSVSA